MPNPTMADVLNPLLASSVDEVCNSGATLGDAGHWYTRTVDEALGQMGAGLAGLTDAEAFARLQTEAHGRNTLPAARSKRAWLRFAERMPSRRRLLSLQIDDGVD